MPIATRNRIVVAEPHDETGHTWHHADELLFRMTKEGMSAIIPGYESTMPAFGEIRAFQEDIDRRASGADR